MRIKITSARSGVEIFDLSLTPDTANLFGYKHIDDIVYNILAPTNAKNDILQLIYENGFKLGSPTKIKKPYYGLYAPINKSL
jgi:hypothetical protein